MSGFTYLPPVFLAADAYRGPRASSLVLLAVGLAVGAVGLVLGGGFAVAGALVAVGSAGTSYGLEVRSLWRADPPAHDSDRRYYTGSRRHL